MLKPALELLAGVPTIVYGYFALVALTPLLQKVIPNLAGFNAISPGIAMGVMIIPMISSLSEDAIYAVPAQHARGRLRTRRGEAADHLPRRGADGVVGHRRLGRPSRSRAPSARP